MTARLSIGWVWRVLAAMESSEARASVTLGLVVLGPMLVLATFLGLGSLHQTEAGTFMRTVLLVDLVYILVVATLILRRIAAMAAARRARSAGATLHMRLSGAFALSALVPAVTVAVFAGLTLNIGLEGWFSERVRSVVAASLEAAETYQAEQRDALSEDALLLGRFLEANAPNDPVSEDSDLREVLEFGANGVQRGLSEAFLLTQDGDIWIRGENSYLFDFDDPGEAALRQAERDGIALIEDAPRNEYRALVRLSLGSLSTPENASHLYVTRVVDGRLLQLLDETQATARLYQQLEGERGRALFQFGLLYLGFALILILAAIWLGLFVAERLSRPIGRLAGAAQRVGAGDLTVRVPQERSDDEIAFLGRTFNIMTDQLSAQREALLQTNAQIDARRRLFDSVLSSVTSGVIGLDSEGMVSFANRAATDLFGQDLVGDSFPQVVPEFKTLFERIQLGQGAVVQAEIRVARGSRTEILLVRMALRRGVEGVAEGYVVAFDDVSELVAAQRMAAWGDVARRIAHEIKNPLTPIRLSAERIRRKFSPEDPAEAKKLGEMTAVIVRQTEDLRRIVDEFSRFARMPRPNQDAESLNQLLREAVTLQEEAHEGTILRLEVPKDDIRASVDRSLIGQALTNLIANAAEAIESRRAASGWTGEGVVEVALLRESAQAVIRITDNGIGLPADPSRLLEPYVTTRDKGTGLGLAIVNKIIAEHGGRFSLHAARPDETGHCGAQSVIILPMDCTTSTAMTTTTDATEEPERR